MPKIIRANEIAAGQQIMISGHCYNVIGARYDHIGNGSAKAPAPRYLANLEWSGIGHNPGPGYQLMSAGASVAFGSWTLA